MFETSPVDFRSLLSNMCLSVFWIKWYKCTKKKTAFNDAICQRVRWLIGDIFTLHWFKCSCQLFDRLSGIINTHLSAYFTQTIQHYKWIILQKAYSMSTNCKDLFIVLVLNHTVSVRCQLKPWKTNAKSWIRCNDIYDGQDSGGLCLFTATSIWYCSPP